MDRPTCKTCVYWDALEDDNEGWCHRYPAPPAVTKVMIEEIGMYDAVRVVMQSTDWCGEHPDFPEYIKSLNRKDEAQAITLRQALEEHRATSSEIAGRAFSALCNEEFEFLDMPLAAIEVRQLVNYVPHFGPACGKQFDTWRGRILRQHSRLPGTPPGE